MGTATSSCCGSTPEAGREDISTPLHLPFLAARLYAFLTATPLRRLGNAAILAILSEACHWFAYPEWLTAILAVGAVLLCGLSTYRKGWLSIRTGTLNINALMSIAVTGGLLIGQWPEASMVMVLFTLSEMIEARSLDRARHAIEGLMRLAPDTATAQQSDGSWQSVPAGEVAVGTWCGSGQASASRWMARWSRALPRWTRRPSRAKACPWKRLRVIPCLPAPSTSPVPSTSA